MLNAIEVMLVCLVLQAALTDLAIRKIPNVLILSGLLLALLLHLLSGPPGASVSLWLAGAVAGLFLFLPLYLLRGMAAGDVKLMAMVGAFVGPAAGLQIAVLSYLVGGLLALALLLFGGRRRQGLHNLALLCKPLLLRLLGMPLALVPLPPAASIGGVPYGVAIAIGTAGWVAWRHH